MRSQNTEANIQTDNNIQVNNIEIQAQKSGNNPNQHSNTQNTPNHQTTT